MAQIMPDLFDSDAPTEIDGVMMDSIIQMPKEDEVKSKEEEKKSVKIAPSPFRKS